VHRHSRVRGIGMFLKIDGELLIDTPIRPP
jgi:hypothetical protein